MSLITAIRTSLQPGSPTGTPDEADLARINAYASPAMAAADVFVFAGVMANAQYRKDQPWRFGLSSLQNFAADAEVGIPYLLQHDRYTNWNGGFTYAAYFDPASSEARAAVWIKRGFEIEPGVNMDTEITAIEAGLRRNLSIGPGGAAVRWTCDLCHEDVFGSICPHVPGGTYDGQMATATVEGARGVELSGVDNGAIPGTVILKARDMARGGKLAASAYSEWCDRFSVPKSHISIPPAAAVVTQPLTGKKETNMREKLASALARLGLTLMAAKVLGAKDEDMDDIAARLSTQVDEEVKAKLETDPLRAACLSAEVKTPEAFATLLADAKLGQQANAAIRADAKAQVVRAKGADEGARWQAACDDTPIDTLKLMSAEWKAEGDKKHPPNGARASAPPKMDAVSIGADDEETATGDRLVARGRKAAGVSNGKEGK